MGAVKLRAGGGLRMVVVEAVRVDGGSVGFSLDAVRNTNETSLQHGYVL